VRITQVIVGAAYGDAITNEALRLRRLLRRVCDSEIYAVLIDPRLADVRPLREYGAGTERDVIIAYVSIGNDELRRFLRSCVETLVIRYHSMTPAEEVLSYDPEYAKLLTDGLEHVQALAPRTSLGLAGSAYSKRELDAMGFERTATCPLLVSADTLLSLEPRLPEGMPATDSPLVLCVGRVVPNKAIEDVLIAFHVLKTYHLPSASLFLVGGRQFTAYQSFLGQLGKDLGLVDVRFLGRVPAPELAGLYRRARVLLCLSRHEGFCAPLVEAMAFGVPVVAVEGTAIGETLGGAGCLLDERSPTLIAEAMLAAITDSDLRERLVASGRRRVRELDPDRSAVQMLNVIGSVL
jgi:glycosyltransferase involved in cell wall biosynthesis